MRTHLANLARYLRKTFKEPRIGIAHTDEGEELLASFKTQQTKKLAICAALLWAEKVSRDSRKKWGGDLKTSIQKWEGDI